MDLNCRFCCEFFDLIHKIPFMYSCGDTICKACAELKGDLKKKDLKEGLNQSSRIFCSLCTLPSDRLSVHPFLKDKLEELQLVCPVHLRKTLKFNKKLEIVFCDLCLQRIDSTFLNQSPTDLVPLNELQDTIQGMLQMKYLDTKDLMMKPAKKFIISMMDKDVMSQYRALKFMNLYKRNSFECDFESFHSDTSRFELKFDSNDFHVLCQECISNLPPISQNHFIGFSSQDLQHVSDRKLAELTSRKDFKYLIWNSVLNHRANTSKTNFAFLAEVCVMVAKKKLNFVENLACSDCNKLYSTGPRFPLILKCYHVKCFSCFLCDKTCQFCCKSQKILSRTSSKPFDQSFTIKPLKKICTSCKKTIKVPKRLPFHSICHCIICSHCMRTPVISCECNISQKLITRLYPRLNKRVLMRILRNTLPMNADLSKGLKFKPDQSSSINLPGTLAELESSEELAEVRKLDDYLKHLLGNSRIPSEYLDLITKKVLPKELKSFTNLLNGQAYFRAFLNLYKNIYPVTRDDRRIFDTQKLNEGKYFMTIECKQNIQIKGFILSGCISNFKGCRSAKGRIVVYDGSMVLADQDFSIVGAADFCEIQQGVYGNKFCVELQFLERFLLFSGSNLDGFITTFRSEGIEFQVFNGFENNGLLYGPITGIVYNRFL